MLKIYIGKCAKENEHQAARSLAEAAFFREFMRSASLSHEKSGKPCFKDEANVHVSISHSGERCAVAISDKPVGIDMEYMKKKPSLTTLADRFFTPDEADYVRALPHERFYEIWCKKESFMKYTGEGFSRAMNSFNVLTQDMAYSHFTLDGYSLAVCCGEKLGKPEIIFIH